MTAEFHCASGAVYTDGTAFCHNKKGTVPYKGCAGKK